MKVSYKATLNKNYHLEIFSYNFLHILSGWLVTGRCIEWD